MTKTCNSAALKRKIIVQDNEIETTYLKIQDSLNVMQKVSLAIKELIDIEADAVSLLIDSEKKVAGDISFLKYFLRSQSFYVTAKSFSDTYQEAYVLQIETEWRDCASAIRHFYSHELGFINNISAAGRHDTSSGIFYRDKGFSFAREHAHSILEKYLNNRRDRDIRKKRESCSNNGCDDEIRKNKLKTESDEIKKIEEKYRNRLEKASALLTSKANSKRVFLTKFAADHYLKLYDVFFSLAQPDESLFAAITREKKELGLPTLSDKTDYINAVKNDVELFISSNYSSAKR